MPFGYQEEFSYKVSLEKADVLNVCLTKPKQLYLIFQPLDYTLKRLDDNQNVVSWKSKSLLTENLTTPITTDNSLSPSIRRYENSNFCLSLKRSGLKQKMQLLHLQIEFFFIVYKLDSRP